MEGKGGRKSRRRRGDRADGDDGTDNQQEEELYLKQQQDKLNDEKRAILHRKNLNGNSKIDLPTNQSLSFDIESERETLLQQLEEEKNAIQREQEQRREMQHKIQQMESKLITGGKDIVTHTTEQEQILRQKRWVFCQNSFWKRVAFFLAV